MRATIRTHNESETATLGVRLGAMLRPGDVVALIGDLGAGKTTMTKGIAQGMGVEAEITSPTFTLVHEHRGDLPLYHIDLYRIESEESIADLGLDEYIYGQGVTIIEWAERMQSTLPEDTLVIRLTEAGETGRDIEYNASSSRWDEVIQELAD